MSAIQREVVGLITQQRWAAIGCTYEQQPLVSMIAYAAEPGLDGLLIFVSMMAAHTRALLEDPRCSLAISDPDSGEGDPQLLKRVTLNGRAFPIPRDDAAFQVAAERYVARFPDAAMRFQLGDFVLLRITTDSARYVGGFARASTFSAAQLQDTARELEAGGPRG